MLEIILISGRSTEFKYPVILDRANATLNICCRENVI